ncbi:hypothetical protein, partial [Stomatobaculum longum]
AWDAIIRLSNQEEKLDAIRYAIDKFDDLENLWDEIGDWLEGELEEDNGSNEETKRYYSEIKKLKERYDKKSI